MSQLVAISVYEFLYNAVVGHFDDSGELGQTLFVDLFFIGNVLVGHVAVYVWLKIHLGIVKPHKAVKLLGHWLGQVYLFLNAVLLCYGYGFAVLGVHGAHTAKKHSRNDDFF